MSSEQLRQLYPDDRGADPALVALLRRDVGAGTDRGSFVVMALVDVAAGWCGDTDLAPSVTTTHVPHHTQAVLLLAGPVTQVEFLERFTYEARDDIIDFVVGASGEDLDELASMGVDELHAEIHAVAIVRNWWAAILRLTTAIIQAPGTELSYNEALDVIGPRFGDIGTRAHHREIQRVTREYAAEAMPIYDPAAHMYDDHSEPFATPRIAPDPSGCRVPSGELRPELSAKQSRGAQAVQKGTSLLGMKGKTMSAKAVIEAVTITAVHLEDLMRKCHVANEQAAAAEVAWSAADACRHEAWLQLQLVETDLALKLRGATDPAEVARIAAVLDAVERGVDVVFRPHDESWTGPITSNALVAAPTTP